MKTRLVSIWNTLYAAREPLRKIAGSLVLLALAIWFVGVALQNYNVWLQQLENVNTPLLLFSLVVSVAGFLFETWIWQVLVADFSLRLSFRDAFQIFYVSNLARYIPGRVWQTSASMVLLKSYGVPLRTSALLSIVSQIATLAAGLVVSLPLVYLWQSQSGFSWSLLASLIGITALLGLVIFFPEVWGSWLNQLLARLGRDTKMIAITRARFCKYVALYVTSWIAAGLAFYVLLLAFYPADLQILPYVVAASAFGYVIGYILLFVPGGLGVREVVLIVVLGLLVPGSIASLVAIVSRFWLVAVELFLGAIALGLFTWGRKPNAPTVK